MGKRHNTLTDDIFRNSKYIRTLEQVLEIEDFRKEYKEQYDIMLDVYKTLITINNIFFSDSNKSKKQKQNEIIDTLEKVIYKSIDDNRAKYSVRTIKGLIDSNTRLLYNKFNEWYENLSYNEKYYDNLKLEVEEEMDTLDNIDFDNIVKNDLRYQKNKNSNYKIYVSKFDYLYPNHKKELDNYKQNFYDIYGIELNEKETNEICLIFRLVTYGNNGLVKLLYDNAIDFGLYDKSIPNDYFNAYLKSLNINMENNNDYNKCRDVFFNEFVETVDTMTKLILKKYENNHIKEIGGELSLDEFVFNYDLYFFYLNMELITTKYNFTIKSDLLLKIIKDLKEVYRLIYDNVPKMANETQVKEALKKIQAIIDRNKNLFERLS